MSDVMQLHCQERQRLLQLQWLAVTLDLLQSHCHSVFISYMHELRQLQLAGFKLDVDSRLHASPLKAFFGAVFRKHMQRCSAAATWAVGSARVTLLLGLCVRLNW